MCVVYVYNVHVYVHVHVHCTCDLSLASHPYFSSCACAGERGRKPSVFFLVRMRGGKGAEEGKEKYVW